MFLSNLQEIPPICFDKATDMLVDPKASQIERTAAATEVEAATVSRIGSIAFAECRVANCPVVCKIFHVISPEGNYQATGIASEEGETDLTNCVRG